MKQHYQLSIHQVSRITGIAPHTLRFWEREFEGVLAPLRSKGGQRRYTREDISLINTITRLRKYGMGISNIKKCLSDEEENCGSVDDTVGLLADNVARVVRSEVYNYFKGREK
ncbi:MAG: MerR family transcriptional regulator [Deltaproteobacteria bacterium]|nr:MerR family transcriptional regulator [Deltaproteobacteria bacterium]